MSSTSPVSGLKRTGFDANELSEKAIYDAHLLTNPKVQVKVDLASDPDLDDPADTSIFPDGTHPGALGYSHVEEPISAALVGAGYLQ